MITLQLAAINLDAELQPRANIDRLVLENYVQLLVDGTHFPPVTVFRADDLLLLADGFHRWHAHKVLDLDTIEAEVLDGTRRDALLYSLSANAVHGLQRKPLDYRRAYEIACRNGLVDATDSEGVAALLHCSGRWSESLTEQARAVAKAARDAAILAGRSDGKTVREVAMEVGVAPQTVINVQKAHSAETGQPTTPPAGLSDTAQERLTVLFSLEVEHWGSALRALRQINEQVPVDTLFAERYSGFDHVFGPELSRAFAWISELHRRFIIDGTQRRRA